MRMLELKNLSKSFLLRNPFGTDERTVSAVRSVSLNLLPMERFGLVGESGSGKSTLGKLMLLLLRPDSGSLLFHGEDITRFSDKKLRTFRRKTGIVFQSPYKSLNPRFSAGRTLHEACGNSKTSVKELFEAVGLPLAYAEKFPHQMSGGERQRVAIARALAHWPELVVADEPTGSLDAAIQHQIISLLMDLNQRRKIAFFFISHDLSLVSSFCTRLAVMYRGMIVESAPTEKLLNNPLHPYTKVLLNPLKVHELFREESSSEGCLFYGRCPSRMPLCAKESPKIYEESPDHTAACFLYRT